MQPDRFYVTTPIYYVNDAPHIGHAYTTVAADCLARYQRLKLGKGNVFFLTGTDEHGQKVEKTAGEANVEPAELADRVVLRFKDLWKRLNISNNGFIRTTEERHKKAVSVLWQRVADNGDIYLGEYEDWYCTPCETFWTETNLTDGKCPDCKRPVEKLKEPSYFFRMGRYQERLLRYIEENPGFIQPESKKNEILSFLKKEKLRDLSISRTSFSWGIPVPGDPKHVVYVWFDALANYLTAAGYPGEMKFWPADIHIIGKDILRFHAIYWPTFLMSAGIALPGKVFAHGWWTVEGQKMSKSLGNVVDPNAMIDTYGADQFRYFLLREVPFGLDGDFSEKAFRDRINGDLADDLGNLLSRTVAMIEKYRNGDIPPPAGSRDRGDMEKKIHLRFDTAFRERFDEYMSKLQFYHALTHLWAAVKEMNEYVDRAAPWREKDAEILSNILYTLAEGLRITALYIYPFMPLAAEKIWQQLGLKKSLDDIRFDEEITWGSIGISGLKVCRTGMLFPKVAA